ncbi:hypothetical protein GCM10010992_19940 [Cloacibacterium rupense]|uniref:Uncharacterized protein n=1 Tax=Cloacibacterium rupense TaxID=517423 RepID=A0ABQ2NJQ8_9FLAO|nr:hypothetical protein [Cloacibacterium rupense]GGP05098.1 hypothetical protein GCM10010992_19940 [Cloacibacterium rupense]
MKNVKTLFFFLFFLPFVIFGQETVYTTLTTNAGEVKIPGEWKQHNTMDDSGQTYLSNQEHVIIAIARNPQKAYPFYKSTYSDFENVKAFYQWDPDYRRENHYKTQHLKDNTELQYVIWKYHDGKLDNIFLFGVSKKDFLNLMVYTDKWSEEEQIKFLENLFKLNK